MNRTELIPTYIFKDMWKFPKIKDNLSFHYEWDFEDNEAMVAAINDVLFRFGLSCQIVDARQGATVHRFILSPTGKTKVQAVIRLENDFKVALNNSDVAVRVENGLLSIEVPRSRRETVYFGDFCVRKEFDEASNSTLCIGMDIDMNPVVYDLRDAVHILIAGQTGSGKSVFMHNLIMSLLMKNAPSTAHLHIIDQKRVEFARYSCLPHCTVTTESADAMRLMRDLCDEMERRYMFLAESGCRDFDEYNEKHPEDFLRREVVFIDELSDLMGQCGKSMEDYIVRIAQKARACGIHLIVATQYPVRSVVTGLIKQNLPTRICLKVTSTVGSMVALDTPGGEKLIGNGDMLFLANGSLKPVRLQGAFVSTNGIQNIINGLMENVQVVYEDPNAANDEKVSPEKQAVVHNAPAAVYDEPVVEEVTDNKTAACGAVSVICGLLSIPLWFMLVPAVIGCVFGGVSVASNRERTIIGIMGLALNVFALSRLGALLF